MTPDKRKAAPTGSKGGSEIDCNNSKIEQPQHSPDSSLQQGLISYAQPPCPVAVARQFGFCHAVYVRHLSGQEERRGLFESAKNAALAAKELNRLFSQERRTGA